MLISSEVILNALNGIKSVGIKEVREWLTKLVNEQSPSSRPDIRIVEEEKVVTLYCSDELWGVVNKWKMKDLKSVSFLDFVRLWKEIKPIIEKENKG